MDPVQLMMMVMVMMKMSDSSRSMEAFGDRAARSKRYAINPLGHKWTHHNITYRIIKFPNTLNVEDTRKAIGIAFTKWSDVSPLTFTEVTDGNATADITIGFYTFNHTDCWWSPLHPCFDGLNGELAHAFLPPRGEIHFDNHEFWILGKSRFSWKQGWSTWYKDGEQILSSIPGYIVMKDRDLRIVANEFNEGVYTCRVHRRGDIVSANSWAIRLKPEQASNS
ncbi:matrix metalloproteinase-23-like [Neolamprologus brichardi]|uniref:matrix metalloproteinase-23-like n=1 Tax=Neolamprologus brichardi TaxID=32507 RepID=UPI0003EC0955|nr:matrix metalloproteinase-23-like [Neolamprologus brichardi]